MYTRQWHYPTDVRNAKRKSWYIIILYYFCYRAHDAIAATGCELYWLWLWSSATAVGSVVVAAVLMHRAGCASAFLRISDGVGGPLLFLLLLQLSSLQSSVGTTTTATAPGTTDGWRPQRFGGGGVIDDRDERLQDNEIVEDHRVKPSAPLTPVEPLFDYAASLYSWVVIILYIIRIYTIFHTRIGISLPTVN